MAHYLGLLNIYQKLTYQFVELIEVDLVFLVDISPNHIKENLENILSNNYSIDERISLIGTVIRDGKEISKNISFNDVVVHK